ncbi:hypothetical protein PPERSA_04436 [Pseudocohnilembus persalinus]|uniref:Uncharacterized protein n=1 Tax=Pseudocohnilembus persalinus TaxID=266149 RepID=A0A0V0QR29_PSEPJ|nr:hypothetical protein PPERSA_04436 [Pseudocohnilembus persalinus]|eukprot:KRX04621.1 hypothetical protein PPERSA_04436 [Pseudocohnilembus persalinus]
MIDYEVDNNNSQNDNFNQHQKNQGSQKTFGKFQEQNGEINNQTAQIINKDNQANQKISQQKQNQLIKKLDIHKAQAINQQSIINQKQLEKQKENEKKSLKNQGEIEDFEAEIEKENDDNDFYNGENDESRHRNLTTNIKKKNSYEKQHLYSQSSKTYRGLISVKDFVQKYKHQDFKLLPSDKPELRPNIHSYMLKNSEKLKEKYGDFRDEIEKRFKASSANKDFQFPRTNFDFYDNDSDSSSHNTSFDSMLGVKEYKLENQNNFKLSTRYKRQVISIYNIQIIKLSYTLNQFIFKQKMRLQREQNLYQENFQKLQQNSIEKAQNEEDVTQRDQININAIIENQQERRNSHQQIKKEDLKLINQDIFKSKAKEREKEEFDKLKEQDIVAKKDFIVSKNSNSKNKHRQPQIHKAIEQNYNQNDQDSYQKQNNLILIQDNQLENNNSNTKQQQQVQQYNQIKDLELQKSEQKTNQNSVGINEIKENYQKKEIQQQIQSQIQIQRSLLKESNKYSKLSHQSDLNKKKIYYNNQDSQLQQQQTFQSENESEVFNQNSTNKVMQNFSNLKDSKLKENQINNTQMTQSNFIKSNTIINEKQSSVEKISAKKNISSSNSQNNSQYKKSKYKKQQIEQILNQQIKQLQKKQQEEEENQKQEDNIIYNNHQQQIVNNEEQNKDQIPQQLQQLQQQGKNKIIQKVKKQNLQQIYQNNQKQQQQQQQQSAISHNNLNNQNKIKPYNIQSKHQRAVSSECYQGNISKKNDIYNNNNLSEQTALLERKNNLAKHLSESTNEKLNEQQQIKISKDKKIISENNLEDYIEASVLTGTKNYQQNADQKINCNNKNFQSYNIGKSHRRNGNSKSFGNQQFNEKSRPLKQAQKTEYQQYIDSIISNQIPQNQSENNI